MCDSFAYRSAWILACLIVSGFETARAQDFYDESTFRTVELTFSDENWDALLRDNWVIEQETGEDRYVRADLTVDGRTYSDVGVQYKGNSSYRNVPGLKKPYKITMDAFVPEQELYGQDILTLNNGVWDPTKIREVLAYKIMRSFMPAPRANIVWLRSGTEGALKDLGVYTNVERVNKRFFRRHFALDDGHRYKAHSGSMNYKGPAPSAYFEDYGLSGGDDETAWYDLIEATDVLNNAPVGELRFALDNVFSIDRLCWQLSAGIALLNWDDLRAFPGRGQNYYLYEDTLNRQLHILPWDWDLAWSARLPNSYSIFDGFDEPDVPLTHRAVLGVPEIKERYVDHLRTLASHIDVDALAQDIQRYRGWTDKIITTPYEAELFSHQDYVASHETLRRQLADRRGFLLRETEPVLHVPHILEVSHVPAAPTTFEEVCVLATLDRIVDRVPRVNLYSRRQGPYMPTPMMDDGQHGDGAPGDLVFGAFLTRQPPGATVEYYVEVYAPQDGHEKARARRYEPIYAEHRPLSYQVLPNANESSVVINEFMADNDTVVADPDEPGAFEDWIELYNGGDQPVALSGMYLTDDLDDPAQFQIPPGVVIEPAGFALFWADDDVAQGPMHTNFKLSRSGEQIGLVASDGVTVVDSIDFGEQTTDVSTGRAVDGGDSWTIMTESTPGYSNAQMNAPPVIRSTSRVPSTPTHREQVWVAASVVDDGQIAAVSIEYDDQQHARQVPMHDDGLHHDGAAGDGLYGGRIPVAAVGTTISYYIRAVDDLGQDAVAPPNAPSTTYQYSVTGARTPVYINEFMAENDTTIQDPDGGGGYPDWIELFNAGDTAIDLSGMYLTDDYEDPTQWRIPDGVFIDAGAHLLLWADNDEEQGDLHTNFKLSRGGEAVALFDTDEGGNKIIDGIVFGPQTADVSMGRRFDGADCWEQLAAPSPETPNRAAYDIDTDGDVDLADYAAIMVCYSSADTIWQGDCEAFDTDCDGDVDKVDFANFGFRFGW